uniref:Uncharacterized protein n=1 Tax=Oryza brachyantha TaxID=4533 RepID=J3MVU1_ORYBR
MQLTYGGHTLHSNMSLLPPMLLHVCHKKFVDTSMLRQTFIYLHTIPSTFCYKITSYIWDPPKENNSPCPCPATPSRAPPPARETLATAAVGPARSDVPRLVGPGQASALCTSGAARRDLLSRAPAKGVRPSSPSLLCGLLSRASPPPPVWLMFWLFTFSLLSICLRDKQKRPRNSRR